MIYPPAGNPSCRLVTSYSFSSSFKFLLEHPLALISEPWPKVSAGNGAGQAVLFLRIKVSPKMLSMGTK